MLQADPLETFPTCPAFGFTSEARYKNRITERDGGYERVDRKWSRPLHRYTAVPMGERVEDDIQEVLYFWHAHGGSAARFRFKDYVDYKSCRLQDDPSPTDQPFTYIAGSPGGYQLVKRYTYGAREQLREITRPKGSSIRVANEFGVEQASTTWLLDEATGLLQTLVGFVGTPSSWGGEFYVYARFDSELPITVTNKQILEAGFAVAEVRETLVYDL